MPRVAIATVSQIAADAGARVAREGGNAVDAAVATTLAAAVTSPAMTSLGGGGYATIWPPDRGPETIDGGFEMPGRGLDETRLGGGRIDVHMGYAGGTDTTVGPGSVATPGVLALCALASERHGRLPWRALVRPSYEHARDGFALPRPSHDYLMHSHESIFGWNHDSFTALHDENGRLLEPGALVEVPHLADSLRMIGEEGVDAFYRGELARRIADYMEREGGILTAADLAAYRAEVRPALEVDHSGWRVATNPPPAVGGVVLAAMLLLMDGRPRKEWSATEVERLIRVQEAVLLHRHHVLIRAEDLSVEAERLVRRAASGKLPDHTSASTVHTSAVDADGWACSITISEGYGSGAVAPGTGIWLNNSLGEIELNPRGFHRSPPGHRLPSNMAPSAVRSPDGAVLAIGSPGADRITTAILQGALNIIDLGLPLQAAIDHPRLHVGLSDEGSLVRFEEGLPVEELDVASRCVGKRVMYFGAVEAASWHPERGLETAADARRVGGTVVAG
jgi:gamma-glutamyltranspeptidase/glutathione hydrolase